MHKASATKKRLLTGMAGFIFLILMGFVVRASYHNTSQYYLRFEAGAVEIWQGTFSPVGKKRILIMPGAAVPAQKKSLYKKEEVYPLAFTFYINKADALMEVPGMPDFAGIKSYLSRALAFATEDEMRRSVRARIDQIDRMILFYKADVAVVKGTPTGLETALNLLDQASQLNPDKIEVEHIKKKKAAIQDLLQSLKETAKK